MSNKNMVALICFKTEEIAKRVATHLYDATVDGSYLVLSKYDKEATELAILLEGVNKPEYSYIDTLEIGFSEGETFYYFLLEVTHDMVGVYPASTSSDNREFIRYEHFNLRTNDALVRLWNRLNSINNKENAVEKIAVASFRRIEDGNTYKYLLTVFGDYQPKEVEFHHDCSFRLSIW